MSSSSPSTSDLSAERRAEFLGEFVSELEYQEDVDNDEVQPDVGEDKESLRQVTERMMNQAADALIGGSA